jgi:hypothetical protein
MPRLEAQLPTDLRFYGAAKVTASSAITIPVRARRELGFEGAPHVFVFGSPSTRHAILAAGPDAPDLLRLLDEWKNRESVGKQTR